MIQNREFGEQMLQAVKERLGDGLHVKLNDIRKNNGVMMTGIVIWGEGHIGAILYLEEIEEDYLAKIIPTIDMAADLAAGMIRKRLESQSKLCGIAKKMAERDSILANVKPKLINYEKNAEMLENVPHKRVLDLAVTYALFFKEDFGEFMAASATVTNELMQNLKISQDELDRAAFENLKGSGPSAVSFGKLLEEAIGDDCGLDALRTAFVVTNKDRNYGASCVLSPGVLDTVADGRDLFVLPASVHEMIVVPCDQGDAAELAEIVRSVNRTDCINENEFLSDSVYVYRKGIGLELAA